MPVFGKKGLTVGNVISGFKNTGTFSVDAKTYKISRLDKCKLKNYNLRTANGTLVDEDGSPVLTTEDESDQTTLVTSDVDNSLSNTAIISSVADAPSPQGKKSCKKCHFQQSRIRKLSVAAAYVQFQPRKIKDNHAPHNHHEVHQ